MSNSAPRVAIIGGGITGLAAAWELQQRGVDYTLFEASDRLGGKIVTEHIDGFTIEGGPDSFLSTKPWAWQLCDELGLRDHIIGTNDAQRNVFVLKDGKLHPYPKGMRLIVPVEEEGVLASNLLSDEGKRRMLAEVDLQPYDAPEDESMASFVRRHFGQEALDVFAEPLLAGIYVGDPEKMSIRATYPQYVEMERTHGSLIRALREAPPVIPDPRAPKTAFFSLKGGTQELVDTLVSKLTGEVRFRSTLLPLTEYDISYLNDHWFIQDNRVSAVINTTVPDLYGRFLPGEDQESSLSVQETLKKYRLPPFRKNAKEYNVGNYLSTTESCAISLGFCNDNVPHPLNGFGLLIPRSESPGLTAITWSSTKILGRAPDDHILIRGFFGKRKGKHWGSVKGGAAGLFSQTLEELFGITAIPLVQRINYWGNSQYKVGYLDFLERIEAIMPPGFYMAGSAYRGVGVPDCIHQGRVAARKAIAHISGKDPNEVDQS